MAIDDVQGWGCPEGGSRWPLHHEDNVVIHGACGCGSDIMLTCVPVDDVSHVRSPPLSDRHQPLPSLRMQRYDGVHGQQLGRVQVWYVPEATGSPPQPQSALSGAPRPTEHRLIQRSSCIAGPDTAQAATPGRMAARRGGEHFLSSPMLNLSTDGMPLSGLGSADSIRCVLFGE